jgi:hypothetical protein
VFFKIDGATVQVSGEQDSLGRLLGIATVTGTTGVGSECRLEPDGSVPVPAEISQWSDQVVPIPLPTILQSSSEKDVGGISGVALVVIRGGGLEADALAAGHAAFNDGMQNALNELIAKHRPLDPKIEPDETKTLFDAVQRAMSDAIAGAMDWKDKVHGWLEPPAFASTYVYFSQDDLPTDDFDQQDFDPTSDHGPALFPWEWEADPNVSGLVGLNGGVGRSRRATGQSPGSPRPTGISMRSRRPMTVRSQRCGGCGPGRSAAGSWPGSPIRSSGWLDTTLTMGIGT